MHPFNSVLPLLVALLSIVSTCFGRADFVPRPTGVVYWELRPGSQAAWNISGTPPFNFEVRQSYGDWKYSDEGVPIRLYWENNTVAANTQNTTIYWTVPQRSYGNWTIAPYVQDSSDDRTWVRSSDERIALNKASSKLAIPCLAGIGVVVISTTLALF